MKTKKILVWFLVFFLLIASVSAFSFNEFVKGLFSENPETAISPQITNYYADPLKVMVGQQLRIIVSFEDRYGVENAMVTFPYEGGYDSVTMELVDGTDQKGTYVGTWTAHDTKNKKWYHSEVLLVNKMGKTSSVRVAWEDPTVSHPAAQIVPGTYQLGEYTYPDNLTVQDNAYFATSSGSVGIGTSSPATMLDVQGGDLTVNGSGTSKIITTDLQIWDDAEGANDYVRVYHDGTNGYLTTGSGSFYMLPNSAATYTNNIYPGSANTRNLGANTLEWIGLYLSEDANSGSYFGLDQDWRLWYNETSADELQLVNGSGDLAMSIANGGTVGIGTTNPDSTFKLDISTSNGGIKIGGASNYALWAGTGALVAADGLRIANSEFNRLTRATGSFELQSPDNITFSSGTSSPTEVMRITSSGNVGIGTTSPGELLEVAGNINSTGGDICISGGNCLSDAAGAGDFYVNETGDAMTGALTIDANNIPLEISNSSGGRLLRVNTTSGATEFWDSAEGAGDYVSIYHDATNGYIKSNSGSLYLWGVNGLTRLIGNFVPDGVNTRDLGASTGEFNGLYLGEDANSGTYLGLDQDWRLWYNETSADELQLVNGSGDLAMSFANNGNVGIGTTSPEATLHVGATSGSGANVYSLAGRKLGVVEGNVTFISEEITGNVQNRTGLELLLGYSGAWLDGSISIDFNSRDRGNSVNGVLAKIKAFKDNAANVAGDGDLIFETAASGASVTTERMRIDSSGNVGIGTASPNELLTVQGNANISGYANIGTTTQAVAQGDFAAGTSTTNFMFWDDSAKKLRLSGVQTTTQSDIYLFPALNNNYPGIYMGRTSDPDEFRIINSGYWQIGTTANVDLRLATSGTDAMTIDGSGNVGIGTTSPGELLEVAGNINSTGGDICISGGNCLSDAGGGNASGDGLANRAAFWTGTTALSYNDNFTWDSTNNRLGIGTTNPGAELHVNGTGDVILVEETTNGRQISIQPGSFAIDSTSNGPFYLNRYSTGDIYLGVGGGQIGIGGQTSPAMALHVGGGSSSHSLTNSQNDTYISGKLEIDGLTYADAQIQAAGGVFTPDDIQFSFGSSGDTAFDWSTAQASANTLVMGLGGSSNSMIFTKLANRNKDFDHGNNNDSTIYIQSGTDPDSDNTEWLSLTYRNASDQGIIDVGKGLLNISDDTIVTGDFNVTSGNDICIGGGNCLSNSGTTYWNLSGSNLFPSSTNYNVSIGTTSATEETVISKVQNGTTTLRIENERTTANGSDVSIDFGGYRNVDSNHISAQIFIDKNQGGRGDNLAHSADIAFKTAASGTTLTERMRITYDGNVGIGTASPSQELDVVGEVTIDSTQNNSDGAPPSLDVGGSWIRLGDAIQGQTFGNGLGIKFHDSGIGHGTLKWDGVTDQFTLCQSNADTNKLQCDSGAALTVEVDTGRVGIGTLAPTEELVVNSTTPVIRLEAAQNPSAYYTEIRNFYNAANPFDLNVLGQDILIVENSAYQTYINGLTGSGLKVGTTTYLYVNSSGNVGIGTTGPSEKLEVIGDIKTKVASSGNDGGISLNSLTSNPYIGFHTSDNSQRFVINTSLTGVTTSDLLILDSTASKNTLAIKGNGNVGIGTTSPNTTLHVAGDINVTTGNDVCIDGGNCLSDAAGAGDFYVNETGDAMTGALTIDANNIPLEISNSSGGRLLRVNTTSGATEFWDSAEGANDYMSIYHDGTNGYIKQESGSLYLQSGTGATFAQVIYPNNDNARDLGTTTLAWRGIYAGEDGSISGLWLGLDQDWRLFYNETSADELQLVNGSGDLAMSFANNGNVGIGTTSPAKTLQVSGSIALDTSTGGTSRLHTYPDNNHAMYYTSTTTGGIVTPDVVSYYVNRLWRNKDTTNTMWLDTNGNLTNIGTLTVQGTGDSSIAGNVGIGTTSPSHELNVVGDLNITNNIYYGGNLTSYGADFAEMISTGEELNSGDVVCFNQEIKIIKCSQHGQNSVAGVVSERPTIIGNAKEKNAVPVGIVGIVKTKVKGPIESFDLLTTSPTPGYAEKAARDDFGAIIGKAMEPCQKDTCEIKVLVGLR